jgi:signal transduction histidine kinase
MFSFAKNNEATSSFLSDFIYTTFFGILSLVFSNVGIGDINLREIPLLICLFHLRSPFLIFLLSLFTLNNSSSQIPIVIVYAVHLLPLLAAWFSFRFLEKRALSNIILGIFTMLVTSAYYLALLLPLVVVAEQINVQEVDFFGFYLKLVPASGFEIITTSLVTGFYLIQYEARKTLIENNKNLENIVAQRTIELTDANNELLSLNEELKASNDSIRLLNDNLEQMVKERTDRIQGQLGQLKRYAHMNSHELRAPLARMLGLLQLIKHENDVDQMKQLLDYLYITSNELDNVIKEMNHLLNKEIMTEE